MSASRDMIPGEAISSEQSHQDSRRIIISRDESIRGKHLGFFTANLFDEYMAKKLQWLNQVASVNQDGTVLLDVPVNVRPKILDIESADAYNEVTDEVSDSEEIQHVLSSNIAILIVGTRGDVQPFVVIGKRLKIYYEIIDALMWLAMRDQINYFRKKRLRILPVTYLHGANIAAPQVPFGYIWSPHLVPKPRDWGPEIDVVGFCFLDLASGYDPPESLLKWLDKGEKPIYIGFGILPIEEPWKMTEIIVEPLETTGQRGIISKGWSDLGDLAEPKQYVYLLDSCPHDWLIPRCSVVVHHGGAGTTAVGPKVAMFWGEQVAARGVGPAPIPVVDFSLRKLVDAILFMPDPKVKERSLQLADAMGSEDGVNKAVKVFYKHFSHRMSDSQCESIGRHARLLNAIDSVYRIKRNIGYKMGRSHGCADEIWPFKESVVSSLKLLAEASTLRIGSKVGKIGGFILLKQ